MHVAVKMQKYISIANYHVYLYLLYPQFPEENIISQAKAKHAYWDIAYANYDSATLY